MEVFKTPYGHGPSMKPHFDKALEGVEIVNKSEIITKWMLILSKAEQQFVREATAWGFLAHRIAYEIVAPGRTPFEVCNEASMEASLAMIKTLGPEYEPLTVGLGRAMPTSVSFTAGTSTAYPHGGRLGERFRKIRMGDNCESGAGGNVGGYGTEIERTFFVGRPNDKQVKYFNIMRKAQDAAYEAMKPGVTCADVCNAAYKVFQDEGVWGAVGHHSGHAKPWHAHIPPYLDPGDKTVLKPGMEFSIEPGIYFKDIGGFRFSDTYFVTEDGAEWVTDQLLTLEENITCI
jgi:Xaa-Pro aminopeptidase